MSNAASPGWAPAVGDRVRVRLRPDCSIYPLLDGLGRNWRHGLTDDGAVGTIVADLSGNPHAQRAVEGHPYEVDFDREHWRPRGDGRHWIGGRFDADELAPVVTPEGG